MGDGKNNVRDLQVVGQVLFVDVLNFVGVLFFLVIELLFFEVILTRVCFCVGCLDFVLFCCFTLCYMVHLVGFSLVCFMEIALPDALWVAHIFQQLSLGDGIWLFFLVWLIAGQFVVFGA